MKKDKDHKIVQLYFHISPEERKVIEKAVLYSDTFETKFDFFNTVKECFVNSLKRVINEYNSDKLEKRQTYLSFPEWFAKDYFIRYGKNLQGGRKHIRALYLDIDRCILDYFRNEIGCRPGEIFRICMLYAAEKALKAEELPHKIN